MAVHKTCVRFCFLYTLALPSPSSFGILLYSIVHIYMSYPNKLNWNWSHVGRLLGCTSYGHNTMLSPRTPIRRPPLLPVSRSVTGAPRGCRSVTACSSLILYTFPFYESVFFYTDRARASLHEFTECAYTHYATTLCAYCIYELQTLHNIIICTHIYNDIQ